MPGCPPHWLPTAREGVCGDIPAASAVGAMPQVGVRELEPAATPPLPRLRRRSFCHRDSVPSAKDTEPMGLVNEQQISCHRE